MTGPRRLGSYWSIQINISQQFNIYNYRKDISIKISNNLFMEFFFCNVRMASLTVWLIYDIEICNILSMAFYDFGIRFVLCIPYIYSHFKSLVTTLFFLFWWLLCFRGRCIIHAPINHEIMIDVSSIMPILCEYLI
jgi:hypothetical protein